MLSNPISMKKIKYLPLLICSLFISCQSSDKASSEGEIKLKIPLYKETSKEVKISDLLEDAFYVPLETKEDNLLGEIEKIKFDDNRIYLLSQNALSCYDMEGNYIFGLDRVGRGPGEYQKLNDFVVDDAIYLFDNMRGNVLVYDKHSLNYQRSINLPFLASEMGKSGENLIFFALQSVNKPEFDYEVLSFSLKDDSVKKYLPYPEKAYSGYTPPYLSTYRDSVIYTSRIRKSAYRVDGNKLERYAYVRTGEDATTANADQVIPYYLWEEGQNFRSLSNWNETEDYIGFQYRTSSVNYAYYNKKTGQTFNANKLKIDVPLFPEKYPKGVYNEYFFTDISASSVRILNKVKTKKMGKEYLENEKEVVSHLYKTLKPAKKTDNPSLLFFKFKKSIKN